MLWLVLAAWPRSLGRDQGGCWSRYCRAASCCRDTYHSPRELQGEQTERIAVIPLCSVNLHNRCLWPMNMRPHCFIANVSPMHSCAPTGLHQYSLAASRR